MQLIVNRVFDCVPVAVVTLFSSKKRFNLEQWADSFNGTTQWALIVSNSCTANQNRVYTHTMV